MEYFRHGPYLDVEFEDDPPLGAKHVKAELLNGVEDMLSFTSSELNGRLSAGELSATYATNEHVQTLAYGTDLEATDSTVSTWVPDTSTLTGQKLAAFFAAISRTGTRAVGKDELITDAVDYGADPSGATSSVAAINTLLASGAGHVLLRGGTFMIDGPIILSTTNQRLTIDETATIQTVPGYSGDAFLIDGGGTSIRGVVIDGGGTITEAGKSGGDLTEPGTWVGVRIRGTSAGTTACRVDGLQMNWPGSPFVFEDTGNGWVNGNIIRNIRVLYPRVLVDVIHSGTGVGFDSNTMQDIMGQAGEYTTHGVRGLSGHNWSLLNVALWDLRAGNISLDIASGAKSTNIIGGLLTAGEVADRSTPGQTVILDRYTQPPWAQSHTLGAADFINDDGRATAITRTSHLSWPVLSYSDGISAGVALWRAPAKATRAAFMVACAGIGSGSGVARMSLAVQQEMGGPENSASLNVDIVPDTVAWSAESAPIVVTPGSLYRISLLRNGGHSEDTLSGDVGLVSVSILAKAS